MPPIYYISEDVIEQLYAEHVGSADTLEVTEEREVGTTFYMRARAGLDNLLSAVLGMQGEVEGEGTREERTTSAETRTFEPNWEARVLELIEELLQSETLKPITDIANDEDENHLYYFDTSLELSVEGSSQESSYVPLTEAMHNGVDRNRNPVMLSATHSSDDVYFTGVTSPDNWVSSSILGNVAMASDSAQVEFSGIVHPIDVDENHEIPQVRVQYVCIGPDSVFQSYS